MTRLVEYIVKNLERSYIFEMAYERREYMNKLFELRLQLVENWALIRYCSLYDKKIEGYNNMFTDCNVIPSWYKHWNNQ